MSDIKSLVSCTAESLEHTGESVLVPNSLLEEYENIRLRQMLAIDEDTNEGGFSLFSTKPTKQRRKSIIRPILPRMSESMQYERPILDVPYKSLPCQAHFIRGNCAMGENCYDYHSVHNAAIHMRHVEPIHPIVLNYRIQKLAHERGQGDYMSTVHDKMQVLNVELQKAKRTKQEMLQQHSELQNNFMNATLKVQELEAENKGLRDLIKNMRQQQTDPMIDDEALAKSHCRNAPPVPRLGKSRGGRMRGRARDRKLEHPI